jgi:hypothetical protein
MKTDSGQHNIGHGWIFPPNVCRISIHFATTKYVNLDGDSSVGIATCYRLDAEGIEFRWGEVFRTRLDKPWGPLRLLCNGYRVPFPGVKRSGCVVKHPPSSVEVKERVELSPLFQGEVQLYIFTMLARHKHRVSSLLLSSTCNEISVASRDQINSMCGGQSARPTVCVCVCVSCAGMQSGGVFVSIVASLAHPSSAWQRHCRITESLPTTAQTHMEMRCAVHRGNEGGHISGSLNLTATYRLPKDDLVTKINIGHTQCVLLGKWNWILNFWNVVTLVSTAFRTLCRKTDHSFIPSTCLLVLFIFRNLIQQYFRWADPSGRAV